MGNETLINNEIANNTVINHQVAENNSTVLNSQLNNGTVLNSAVYDVDIIQPGTVLFEKYIVVQKLDTNTGEADLYLCSDNQLYYIAKKYRRKEAVKDEIIHKLINLDSQYVAKVYASGEYNGCPLEIMPYYKNGSLQGRQFSYMELKTHIIPSLNEGINTLHKNGIIHKDLKPSNIMLADNQVDVAIIDFGISSVREGNNTVVVTKTGMTPEYSAPETFRGLYLTESDYYSFGIAIYELFCGRTPYASLSQEEIEKFVSIQKIPFPDNMPDDLKNLISALTYYDITNRRNKSNPNRRWGFEEVKRWCNGEKQIIPGEGIGNADNTIKPYSFKGKTYSKKSELALALAENWNEGKKELFRGILSGYYKATDPQMAGVCMDAEEESARFPGDEDVIFFKFLYAMDDDFTKLVWKGETFKDLPQFGRCLLNSMWSNNTLAADVTKDMLRRNVFSLYAKSIGIEDDNIIESIRNVESTYEHIGKDNASQERLLFLVAYLFSGNKILRIDNIDYCTVDELVEHMNYLIYDDYGKFVDLCEKLMGIDGELLPQFESWLISLNKQQEIKEWRTRLS